MAFVTTNLSEYVKLVSTKVATLTVFEPVTAKLLINSGNVQTGVKGEAPILKMDVDVIVQDGSTCGRTPLGNTVLSDAKIIVKSLKDQQNLCSRDLYNKYFSFALRTGQDPETELSKEFANDIMNQRAAKIAEVNENLIWQGDTSLTGTNNLKWINGFLKQQDAATDYIDLNSTQTSLIKWLQEAALKIPSKIRNKSDFYIFVGEDVYDMYTVELANLNIYKPTEDAKIFGTSVRLQAVPGLNGTNRIFASRLSNLQLGLDMTGEEDSAKMTYSVDNEVWYQDFYWSLGVAIIYTSETGKGVFAPAV